MQAESPIASFIQRPVSGLCMKHLPDTTALGLPNWAFRIAFRVRFGLILFAQGATCCLSSVASTSQRKCGQTLDQSCIHAITCKFGGGVLEFHDCVKAMVWQACRAAGDLAYKEQVVPQWGKWIQKLPWRRQRQTQNQHDAFSGSQPLDVP